MDRLEENTAFLKRTITKEHGNSEYIIDSLEYVIEQARKAQRYEKVLKEIYSRKSEVNRAIRIFISKTLE